LDPDAGRVWRGDTPVPLAPRPFALLRYLAERPGRLIGKDELLDAVWPGVFVGDAVLKVAVREIRRALDDPADEPLFIETVHGRGYRFRADPRGARLPATLTSFIGRATEMVALRTTLANHRLTTLRGVGGCGKTRLAHQAALDQTERFADGVWWIDLVGIERADLVVPAIAATLGVRDRHDRDLTGTLGDLVRARELLLVLDNCEHVLAGCVPIVENLLSEGPGVRVLTTSREPLGLAGEVVLVVPPLGLPTTDVPETIRDADAVRLFIERAQDADPRFEWTDAVASTVAAICRRVDGLPLAIELIAARVNALSLGDILARVDDRLPTVSGREHASAVRHRSLSAVIGWSDELLRPDERQLLRQLSVFAGTFSLRAIDAVSAVNGEADFRDLVTALVNKSLVTTVEGAANERRYRLLELVRQYARDALSSSERLRLLDRHATFFAALAAEQRPLVNGPHRGSALAALTAEAGNFRAALDARLTSRPSAALHLAASLWWWWFHTNQWREGRDWLEAALEATASEEGPRAEALCGAGALAWFQGDHVVAHARLEDAVRRARVEDETTVLARALDFLGQVHADRGEPEAALACATEAVSVSRASGDAWELAIALIGLGNVRLFARSHEQAQSHYTESASICRAIPDAWAYAMALRNLGIVARHQHELERSTEWLRGSLAALRDLDHEQWFVSRSLEELAKTLVLSGEAERVATLFGAAEALRERVGAPVLSARYPEYAQAVSDVRRTLGDVPFQEAWAHGRSLDRHAAIALAVSAKGVG
jgi:non-specific serine/threonine protein kinase